jgi:hypothetical protein
MSVRFTLIKLMRGYCLLPGAHTMTTYMDLLLDVARGVGAAVPPPPAGSLGDPATFLLTLFHRLGQTPTITRAGVDTMMDAVFAVEDLRTTLTNAADIQAHFAATYLPHTSATYGAFWTHVIVPAWNQHAEAYQVALGSAAR